MRAICMGVTSTWPCPIDMLTVSPACHDIGLPFFDILGCGMSPGFSLPNSMPVMAPKPKACAHLAMDGAPTLRPAL